MIICEKCGKENADHYKFCLGCGSDISNAQGSTSDAASVTGSNLEAAAQKNKNPKKETHQALSSSEVPPTSSKVSEKNQTGQFSAEVACARCGAANPSSFKFCGECGFNLKGEDPLDASSSSNTGSSSHALAKLTLILPDGSEGATVSLKKGKSAVGREYGSPFDKDMFLSPKHATFFVDEGSIEVEDESSLNGVYLKILPDQPEPLQHGSTFRIGQEVIQYETVESPKTKKGKVQVQGSPLSDAIGMIRLVLGRETYGNSLCIPSEGIYLGRERGQAIFPEDGYVSALHCRIHQKDGKMVLVDLGSSNGTYVRISKKTKLENGAFVLIGQQLFRLDF